LGLRQVKGALGNRPAFDRFVTLEIVRRALILRVGGDHLVRRFRQTNDDWNQLPEKVAIQLNDTHPSMAVPELMRILLDEAHLGWDQAWELTRKVLAYTNHTLLPEALEKWPVQWFQDLLPRHLEIIFEINRRLLDDLRLRYPGDETRVANVSLIEEGSFRKVRMANLAIVGSHSTKGPPQNNLNKLVSHGFWVFSV
jgi:starch phosphorylase